MEPSYLLHPKLLLSESGRKLVQKDLRLNYLTRMMLRQTEHLIWEYQETGHAPRIFVDEEERTVLRFCMKRKPHCSPAELAAMFAYVTGIPYWESVEKLFQMRTTGGVAMELTENGKPDRYRVVPLPKLK